jgi:hypothetical protein
MPQGSGELQAQTIDEHHRLLKLSDDGIPHEPGRRAVPRCARRSETRQFAARKGSTCRALILRYRAFSRRLAGTTPCPHPIALSLCRNNRGVVGEAIEERGRQLLVPREGRAPLGEREAGSHYRRASFVAIGEEIEEQARELSGIARLEQPPHQVRAPCEEPAALRRVASTRSAIAKCVFPVPIGPAGIRFPARSPFAAGQRVHLPGVDPVDTL